MKDLEDYCPSDKKDWREWLALNHLKKDAVWLILHKKTSSKHKLNWSEAVDEVLCFGWIDSTKKAIVSEKFKQFVTSYLGDCLPGFL